jgi:hypothetical protein
MQVKEIVEGKTVADLLFDPFVGKIVQRFQNKV